VAGLVLLVAGAETLVRGAARLASSFGVSALVIGLTEVAIATRAPEHAGTLSSTWAGETGMAMGDVGGSNIANVLLILRITARAAPLLVAPQIRRLDVPLMVIVSVLVLFMSLDGSIDRYDGAVLAAGLVAYVVWTVRASRRQGRKEAAEARREIEEIVPEVPVERQRPLWNVGLVAAGLGMLVLGAHWLVEGAVAFALWLGASRTVVGLTIVAIGTSLPELATSVVATLRGQRDIAVGNAIGSNIFNLLCVLGFTGLLAPAAVVVPESIRGFDLPVMIAVAAACLPVFFVGHKISRGNGVLFLFYYAAYLAYLVLDAKEPELLRPYGHAMLFFVVPITTVALGIYVVRHLRAGGRAR
jgi:cation:H+ antiporter